MKRILKSFYLASVKGTVGKVQVKSPGTTEVAVWDERHKKSVHSTYNVKFLAASVPTWRW